MLVGNFQLRYNLYVKLVISYDIVKYQDHRPGKSDPKNRNANSATQQETQPSVVGAQKSGQKRSFPMKGNSLDLKTLKEKDCTEVVHKLNESMTGL